MKEGMKKTVVLLLLLTIITATPSYALNFFEKIKYAEVRLGSEQVLVNRFTGRVEHVWAGKRYEPISTEKGFGGIPSVQDMYQAQYEKSIGR